MKNKDHRLVWIESWLVDAVLDSPKLMGTYGIEKRINRAVRDWVCGPPENGQEKEHGNNGL